MIRNRVKRDDWANYQLVAVFNNNLRRITRETIRNSLLENNIESRPLWKPMHLQPVFEDYPSYLNGVSEALFEKGLCLPSGSNLTEEEKKRIEEALFAVLK